MRGHKFLIIEGDSYIMDGEFDREDVVQQIVWNEMECLTIITCPHEEFEDNVIVLQSDTDPEVLYSVVRDMNGRLFYFLDHLTKTQLVNMFEQVDE